MPSTGIFLMLAMLLMTLVVSSTNLTMQVIYTHSVNNLSVIDSDHPITSPLRPKPTRQIRATIGSNSASVSIEQADQVRLGHTGNAWVVILADGMPLYPSFATGNRPFHPPPKCDHKIQVESGQIFVIAVPLNPQETFEIKTDALFIGLMSVSGSNNDETILNSVDKFANDYIRKRDQAVALIVGKFVAEIPQSTASSKTASSSPSLLQSTMHHLQAESMVGFGNVVTWNLGNVKSAGLGPHTPILAFTTLDRTSSAGIHLSTTGTKLVCTQTGRANVFVLRLLGGDGKMTRIFPDIDDFENFQGGTYFALESDGESNVQVGDVVVIVMPLSQTVDLTTLSMVNLMRGLKELAGKLDLLEPGRVPFTIFSAFAPDLENLFISFSTVIPRDNNQLPATLLKWNGSLANNKLIN